MLGSSDFLEIVVISEDEAAIGFRKGEELIVDRSVVEVVAKQDSVEKDHAFELADGIEAGTGPGTLIGIFAIGQELEFVRDAARNENIITDEAGLGDRKQARIHEGRGVDVDFAALAGADREFLAILQDEKGRLREDD